MCWGINGGVSVWGVSAGVLECGGVSVWDVSGGVLVCGVLGVCQHVGVLAGMC